MRRQRRRACVASAQSMIIVADFGMGGTVNAATVPGSRDSQMVR